MAKIDTIRVRRDTAATWASVNPVLLFAEIGLETDTRKIKFGDGVTAWTGLAYSYTGSGTVTGVTGTAPIASSGGVTPAISIAAATGAAAGSMSAADKTKLDAITGTNTGDQTTITGNAGTATKLSTARTLGITGDLVWTSPVFDGSANVTAAGTLATVNVTTGTFGSATKSLTVTANGKGLITSMSEQTVTPAVGSITGLGTGVGTALGIAVGSAGAPITFNGALGTPSSGTLTNCTFPTLNQNTTGSAATLTTSRNIDGQAFNGSANITVIAPGTHAATTKTTPVDADELPLVDSAASNVLAKLTWANLKATLKTYFDTLYPAYSTGTFTPSITLGGGSTGVTYGAQTGRYTKKGRDVRVEGVIQLGNKGSSTGAFLVTGLPFTSNSSGFPYAIGSVLFASGTSLSSPVALIVNNSTSIAFYNQSSTTFVQLDDTYLTNTSQIYFTIEYTT